MALTEVGTHYRLALSIDPVCAKDWQQKGLDNLRLIEEQLRKETQEAQQCKQKFLEKTQRLLKNIGHVRDFELFSRDLNQWLKLSTSLFETVDQQYPETVGNAYKSAIQYFHQAVNACDDPSLRNKIKSELIECLAQYGHYLYKRGEYQKAQKYYQQVLKFDPDHISVLNQMGMCLSKDQSYVQAREYFEEILTRTTNPLDQADAWLNIACTYRLQNNYRKAAHALSEAKRLAPNDVDILAEERELRGLVSSIISIQHHLSSNPYGLLNARPIKTATQELNHPLFTP